MIKREFFIDLVDLTKPRICALALIMSTLGFLLGTEGAIDKARLVFTLIGLALVGASSGAFNQYLEKDVDALMWRTLERPLPAGRLQDKHALWFGFLSGALGEMILLFFVNPLTCVLGALTLLFYVGVYTPSKRLTPLSTLVGAIPGALPPLMGFTASHGNLAKEGILLFAILFIWQIPHFLAIAWIYREDYKRASMPILSVVDEFGSATSKQVVLYSIVLLPLTLVPTLWGVTGLTYLWGSLFLGLAYLLASAFLAWKQSLKYARALFITSIVYLPLLGILMVWDRQ